jgi:hypothetical protein
MQLWHFLLLRALSALLPQQRRMNRPGRHERKPNAAEDDHESQAAANPDAGNSSRHQHRVRILVAVLAVRQLDDGREHVEKWNEVENDAGVDQLLIGALRRLVDLAAQQNGRGDPACTRIETHGVFQRG